MESASPPKTVAIIGGGAGGLVSCKEALANGLAPTVFEKNSQIGGIWNQEYGYTWDSMITNFSYFRCMFSDFNWPANSELFQTRETS